MENQSNTMHVQTIDDIFVSALNLSAGLISLKDLHFSDDFTVKIKLKGDQWDGKIDYKIAKFVLNIQNSVLNIYNKTSPKMITYKSIPEEFDKLKIKVDIKNGSTELVIAFNELLQTIQSLPTDIGSTILIGFGALCGIYTLKGTINGFHERAKEISRIEAERDKRLAEIETQNKFADIVKTSLHIVSENSKATYELAKNLSENDIFIVNQINMSKSEALEAYYVPETEDSSDEPKSLTVKIDEEYQVKAAFMEKQEVQLSFRGAKSFKATTRDMQQQDKELLYKQFAEADMLAISPSIRLQINAIVTEGTIAHATIVKIGAPRPGFLSIFKALEASISQATISPQNRQGNLLALE